MFDARFTNAQPIANMRCIGYLSPTRRETQRAWANAPRQELRKLGWIEDQNITIEYRWVDGRSDRLIDLANAFVHLPIHVLIAGGGTPVAYAARKARSTLPMMLPQSECLDAVRLMSYAENLIERWRRAAIFVDKILRGRCQRNSAGQPMKFEFVVT